MDCWHPQASHSLQPPKTDVTRHSRACRVTLHPEYKIKGKKEEEEEEQRSKIETSLVL